VAVVFIKLCDFQVSTNSGIGTQAADTPAKQVSTTGRTPAKLVQSASHKRPAEKVRTPQAMTTTSFYKTSGENHQIAGTGTGDWNKRSCC